MDSKRTYRKEKGKVYRREKGKVQPSVHYSQYRSHDYSPHNHNANLHFVSNGQLVETIESDVSFSWANSRKKELQNTVPYCYGKLVVVSIYAKDQINGGKRRSSQSRTIR